MARNKKQYEELCPGIFQVSTKQSVTHEKAGELHSLEISEGLWQEISIDIIGPLPRSNGKNAIVVIID